MVDLPLAIERSPLCGKVKRDGEAIDVQIYRVRDGDPSWSLEVTDGDGGTTVWTQLVDFDQAAYAEFCTTLEREGIASCRPTSTDSPLH